MRKNQTNDIYILHTEGQSSSTRVEGSPEIMLAVFLLSGIIFSLQQLAVSVSCLWIAEVLGILTVLVRWFIRKREKRLEQLKNVMYLAVIISFVMMRSYIIAGILELVNRILVLWNLRFGTDFTRFSVSGGAVIGAWWIWGVLAIVLASFIADQIKKKALYGLLPVILCAMYVNYVLGQRQILAASYFLGAGIISMAILYGTVGRNTRRMGYLHFVCMCAAFAGIVLLCRGYTASSVLDRWKSNVEAGIERIRYGEDTLPEGDFQKAAGLTGGSDADKHDTTLQVTMDKPQELYLKGFVGGVYKGTSWGELPEQDYQNAYEGMLKWLDDQGLEPVTQYAEYDSLTRDATYDNEDYSEVRVENQNANRKYLYMPEGTSKWNASLEKVKKDWQVRSGEIFGTDNYSFQMVNQMPTAEEAVTAEWLENGTKDSQERYRKAEAVYHTFVTDNYMDISDDMEKLIADTFFQNGVEDMSFADVTRQIRQVLRDETVYNDSPVNVPQGTDLIRWFLKDYKQGNAVSYATTAVMAYREAGYPARYVEGYHLDDETAQAMTDASETEADLTAANAHAWVEVYVSGMGWLPVEVVPGMYVEAYTNQTVAGKPSYQVNASEDKPGSDKAPDEGKETSKDTKKDHESALSKAAVYVAKAYDIILILLYLTLVAFLILEAQRAVRLRKKHRKVQTYTSAELADSMARGMAYIYRSRGIDRAQINPKEQWEELSAGIPGLSQKEYSRVRELIEKVRFGGIELKPYEMQALRGLCRKLADKWYESCNMRQKIVARYVYLIEKE